MAKNIFELVIDEDAVRDTVYEDTFYELQNSLIHECTMSEEQMEETVKRVMERKDDRHAGTMCFDTWFYNHCHDYDLFASVFNSALRDYCREVAEEVIEEEQA